MSRLAKVSDNSSEPIPLKPIALAALPDRPLVSVLMSNYNYGSYLSDAIESVLGQTYRNLEVIICDDGSTDASLRILERYRWWDARIKVLRQPHGGQSLALNAAFRESLGEIICLLDADDVFLPNKVELVVSAFTAAPNSGFAVHRMWLVDKDRKYLSQIPSFYDLPCGWQAALLDCIGPRVLPGLPPTSGLSLHRSVAEALFPLPAGLRAYSDTLIQAVAPLMTPISAINSPLSEYRVHGANVGGISRFTVHRLRNIVLYEREIWGAWHHYLAVRCSQALSKFAIPSERALTVMDYAYSRFRLDRNFKSVYRSIPLNYFKLLPKPLRWYWRASVMLPAWLFPRTFNFVYGHTRTKMIARRVLNALRSGICSSPMGRLAGRPGQGKPESNACTT